MQRILRLLAVALVVGALALATALPAFAKGPSAPVADYGLGTAVTQVIEHALVPGTHIAACTVSDKNPATSLEDPGCP